jgi:hypothetical protein
MKRTLVVCGFVCLALIGSPRPAAADGFWGWLEDLSGPGPFKGTTLLATFCRQDGRFQPTPIAREGAPFDPATNLFGYPLTKFPLPNGEVIDVNETGKRSPEEVKRLLNSAQDAWRDRPLGCFYFDTGFFSADADTRFPAVNANLYDFGGSVRMIDGLDIGGGIGWVNFRTDTSSHSKLTLTPLRIVARPLLIALPGHLHQRWMGVISLYWKEILIVGPISGSDFGVDPAQFQSKSELVRSLGMIVDVTALLPRFGKK